MISKNLNSYDSARKTMSLDKTISEAKSKESSAKEQAPHKNAGEIPRSERRNSKRFDERLHARLKNKDCTVLNVSAKGVLLQTVLPDYYFSLDKVIDFDLQLENGEWVPIQATVMWTQFDQEHSKIGLDIKYAPEPYFLFLKELLE